MTLLSMDRHRRGEEQDSPAAKDHYGHRIVLDQRIERSILLVLFILFVSSLWGAIQIQQLSKSVAQIKSSTTDVTHIAQTLQRDLATSTEVVRGNRVVSCADLAVQAPQVALRLPQCAPNESVDSTR